jgi:F-type H+-transporting ATPase subunit b
MFVLGSLITPGIGLIFWTSVVFLLLLFLLGKYAWKPILNAIKTREEHIKDALSSADKALRDMRELQSNNDKILQQARAERDALLKEARATKDSIIAEAKTKAQEDAVRIVEAARELIENEKNKAHDELRKQVAQLSVEIAEKVLRQELKSDSKQMEFVKQESDRLRLS